MAEFKKHITLNVALIIAIAVILVPFVSDIIRGASSGKALAELPPENAEDAYYYDDADLFTANERASLTDTLNRVTSIYPVALVTTDDTDGKGTQQYTRELFGYIFPEGKGILFVIDTENSYLYLYTDNGNTALSVSKCDTITDNVYTHARSGDFFTCAKTAFEQIFEVMSGIAIPQPMKHMSNLLIAVCAALFGVFVYANQKTRIKTPAEVYQLDKNSKKEVYIENANARLIRSYNITHSSGSSGGRSHGGGFGGGGGGGGGGGHGGGHGF